jgi:hypothetical protein
MRNRLIVLVGAVLSIVVLQWYIIATREPYAVRCDGGMEGEG